MLILLYGLIGIAVGSFLNVVIDRVPERASLVKPPSHCPYCGRTLKTGELIPIVSYLLLRGRCRTCGASIPVRVPIVEAAGGLLFAFLCWRFGLSLRLLLYTVFSSILLVIMVIDLEHKLVLNRIVLPAILLAVLTVPLQRLMAPPLDSHYAVLWALLGGKASGLNATQIAMISQLVGGVIAFGIFFIIWLLAPQGMGAGDVKLAAFAGLVTAFPGALAAVFGSFVLGGVVAIVLLVGGAARRKTLIPFAPFLVITTFLVMVYGDQLLYWYLGR